MEYLYVCQFSNGHIKVGRSVDPQSRIASHAERVSCIGLGLTRHSCYEVTAPSVAVAEAGLIERCAGKASDRHKHEWFLGLDYEEVCEWAASISSGVAAPVVPPSFFQAIVLELCALGYTQTDLARHCGCYQSRISEIAAGKTKDPLYSLGAALVALHAAEKAKAA